MREAELSPDHCPNCGRPLKFTDDQTEGLCPSCGIFVEIPRNFVDICEAIRRDQTLTPLRKSGSMGLAREHVIAATRRELEKLCREHGLAVGGKKADLIARLVEYIDRRGSKLQAVSEKRDEPQSPAASGLDDIAKRAELALLFLNLEQFLDEPEEADDIKEEDRAPSSEPTPKPSAEVPEATSRGELPPPLFAETSAEEVGEFSGDYADVETFAPAQEVHPPEPPSEAEAQGEAVVAEPAPHVETAGRSEPTSEVQSGPVPSHLRLDRAVFYIGAVHVAIGGAAFLLGSLLHDMFRVPFFGDAYEAFGSLNVAAALIGVILALAGIGAMAIGLRGGVIRAKPVAEA